MSNDEAERRIEEAAQKASRQKETADFIAGLTANDELLKPIYNPEAWYMRNQAQSAATRNETVRKGCLHPLDRVQQFVDDDPSVKRNSKPVNLFACGVCGCLLWFVDPWGIAISDG